MYPTSNSFVFRASFSSARNRSNSMRNNDSCLLIAGTGSVRSCGGASGSNRMIGLRLVAAHRFGMGQSLPRYGLQMVNAQPKLRHAQ